MSCCQGVLWGEYQEPLIGFWNEGEERLIRGDPREDKEKQRWRQDAEITFGRSIERNRNEPVAGGWWKVKGVFFVVAIENWKYCCGFCFEPGETRGKVWAKVGGIEKYGFPCGRVFD